MSTIYISIAAYRDPELVPTIQDCLDRAAHPENLRFGICWQHGPEEPPLPWMDDPRFRIMDVDWRESRGACWARAELMHRYDGETYFLQLDSHHRFVDRWDEKVIAQLERTGSAKPVLTAYATPFNPATPDEREDIVLQMNFDRFTEHAIILFRPGGMRDLETRTRPQPARFLSGHFLFTIGDFVREVPYDPDLYFIGEEITLAVRAFTHGYDLFHPTEIIVWHEYTREYREHKHWTDHNHDKGITVAWHERDKSSLARVQGFLEEPWVGPFGLGAVRTFEEYEAYAGVNFRLRRAQEYTKQGFDPPNPPAPADWAERIQTYELELAIERAKLPADVDDYQFWYVGVHDEAGQEIFRQDADREELNAILADAGPVVLVKRSFETDRIPKSWTVWPVSESRGWLDKIEGPILPNLPPVTLVTALLDLGRDRLGEDFGRSFDAHYLPLFERLLAVDLPMVVYVAPEHESVVWQHRSPNNTEVRVLRREDLEAAPWYVRVQQIRTDPAWRNQAGWLQTSPQAELPHYNPLVLSKMRLLADVARDNPFASAGVYWIDAGLANTVPESLLTAESFVPNLMQATGEFLWVEYPYRDGHEIHGFPRRELARLAGVRMIERVARGGFFGGAPDRVAQVAAEYDELLDATLARGLMGTEESLFTILLYRAPDRFSHYLVGEDGLMGPFFTAVVGGAAESIRKPPEILPATTSSAIDPIGYVEEHPDDVRRGMTTFLGLPMMHNRHAVLAFDGLYRHLSSSGFPVARVIDIAPGPGGLAALHHLYCTVTGATFIVYDRDEDTSRAVLFNRLGVHFRQKDVDHDFVRAEIAREIQQPGLTVLLCDGPQKAALVRAFADYLKPGDLILAHDYASSSVDFELQIRDRFWNWCELTDADIADVIERHRLEPLLVDLFRPAAWMCKVKRGDVVVPAPVAQGTTGQTAIYVLTYNAPEQLARWCTSVATADPSILDPARSKVLLNNSTDETTFAAYDEICARHGFTQVRQGNLGILGGRLWCARHFADESRDDFMVFFEDDMLLYTEQGVCRNGFPTYVPNLLAKTVEIVRNEPSLDYLKWSFSEFYGDHLENWAYYNLDPARRPDMFPDGHRTRVDAVKSHDGLAYAMGEIYYSNWPMVLTRAGNEKLFLRDGGQAARFEQTLMVRALELQRGGQLGTAVLLASPVNHQRDIHYETGTRKES